MQAAGRVAMRAVGGYWVRTYLPLHFENTAFFRYGYTARNPAYRKRKINGGTLGGEQSIGEDRPLVWSGRSRERAKAARVEAKAPSGSKAYAEVVIDAPALNFRPVGSRIDMRDEVTRVNQQEISVLSDIFVRAYEKELIRMGKMKRRYRKVA
jgi:hypothetical protein